MENQSFTLEIQRLEQLLTTLRRQYNRVSTARLLAVLAALGCFLAAWLTKTNLWLWPAAACLVLFVLLIIRHAKIDDAIKKATALAAVNQAYLNRQNSNWKEAPCTGQQFADPQHPYSADLDIFGQASLYQYLCCAHTWHGQRRLAALLAGPPATADDIDDILYRQQAVKELAPKLDFCRNLQGEATFRGGMEQNPEKLLAYAENDKTMFANPLAQLGLALLSAAFVASLVLAGLTSFIPPAVPLVLLAVLALFTALGTRHTAALGGLGGTKRMLEAHSGLIQLVSGQSFKSSALQAIADTLLQGNAPATGGIKKLATIAAAVEFRSSGILFFIANLLFLWDYHCIFALERWKARYGKQVRHWLQAIGALEAYTSLATPAQVRQQYAYPTFQQGMVLQAAALAHPLILQDKVVANTLAMQNAIFIVTGSNMSGKTTLLRTVGSNLVLAYAGAPVAAQSLTCGVMQVYTSMRNADDLGEGISTFYAELLRIKTIVQAAKKQQPMLFLLDELFKGTNSADRVAGAKAVLQGLNKPWCMGLISTHDFELCALAKADPARIHNVHFTEHYVGDEIHFDYTMRPGRCQTTNARHLMRLVGIDLEE